MKKLLSILASVGLVATASSAVVACTTVIKAKDVTITEEPSNSANYLASWSETVRLNKNTKYSVKKDKDGNVVGYYFMPYKLHLVADTTANESNDAKPTDLFSPWNEKTPKEWAPTIANGATAEFYTTANWMTKDSNVQNVKKGNWTETKGGYTTKAEDYGNDGAGVHMDIDGIVSRDITVKLTITVVIPKASVQPGEVLKVALVREEPYVTKYGDDEGKYITTHSQISIEIPASQN